MLSGVALARRLGDHLVAPLPPPDLEDGFRVALRRHRRQLRPLAAGRPRQHVPRRGRGAGDCSTGRRHRPVVLRRPRLRRLRPPAAVPHRRPERQHGRVRALPRSTLGAARSCRPRLRANPAWIAVHTGFEVQVDDLARDDGADCRRTGALYDIATTGGPATQTYSRGSALQPGAWNDYEITVSGDSYAVRLNDHVTSVYANPDPTRGVSADQTRRRASSACSSTPATSPSEPCASARAPLAPASLTTLTETSPVLCTDFPASEPSGFAIARLSGCSHDVRRAELHCQGSLCRRT